MSDMKVYLAGPINGCSDGECVNWREQVKSWVHPQIEILDPMERDYRGIEMDNIEDIIHSDKKAIHSSTFLLANVTRPSAGTSMEIFWAWSLGIGTYAFTDGDPNLVSPWIAYHCRFISTSARFSFIKAVKDINGDKNEIISE